MQLVAIERLNNKARAPDGDHVAAGDGDVGVARVRVRDAVDDPSVRARGGDARGKGRPAADRTDDLDGVGPGLKVRHHARRRARIVRHKHRCAGLAASIV